MRGLTLIDVKSNVSKHTSIDWDLIMSGKVIGTPEPRIVKVDMADRDGDIDMTEELRGRVSYKNRALSFSFICTAHQSTWADLRAKIASFVHGKLLHIVDPDTPDYYYIARCTLKEPTFKGSAIMFLEIAADAQPYRISQSDTTIRYQVSQGAIIQLNYTDMPVVPTLTPSGDMTIRFGAYSVSLTGGKAHTIPELVFDGRIEIVVTSGSGYIDFAYRKGVI